jgi:hypothetical protein
MIPAIESIGLSLIPVSCPGLCQRSSDWPQDFHVAARHAYFMQEHPIYKKKREEEAATLLPGPETLMWKREECKDLQERIKVVQEELRILEDLC